VGAWDLGKEMLENGENGENHDNKWFTGERPSIERLRVLGCGAYVFIPSEIQENKMAHVKLGSSTHRLRMRLRAAYM